MQPRAVASCVPSCDADLVIVGADVRGLALALALRRAGSRRHVTILETRTDVARERTWLWWGTSARDLGTKRSHHWNDIAVQTPIGCYRRSSAEPLLLSLESRLFAERALEELGSSVTLALGTAVHQRRDSRSATVLTTSRGQLRARFVIDARPGRPQSATPPLFRSSVGWEVTMETAVFTPDAATVMDLVIPQTDGVRFLSVFPSTAYRALIVHTAIAATPLARNEHEAALATIIDLRYPCQRLRIDRRQTSVLALGLPARHARHGTAFARLESPGCLRSAVVGPEFGRMQSACFQLASAVSRNQFPVRYVPPRADDERDFIRCVQRHPARAGGLLRQWLMTAAFRNAWPHGTA